MSRTAAATVDWTSAAARRPPAAGPAMSRPSARETPRRVRRAFSRSRARMSRERTVPAGSRAAGRRLQWSGPRDSRVRPARGTSRGSRATSSWIAEPRSARPGPRLGPGRHLGDSAVRVPFAGRLDRARRRRGGRRRGASSRPNSPRGPTGLADQDQERGLEGVLGVVGVAEDLRQTRGPSARGAAPGPRRRARPPRRGGEEPFEELTVGETTMGPLREEDAQ